MALALSAALAPGCSSDPPAPRDASTGTVAQSLSCGPIDPNRDIFAAIQTTVTPPHKVFCGSMAKAPWASEATNTNPPSPGLHYPGDSPPGAPPCKAFSELGGADGCCVGFSSKFPCTTANDLTCRIPAIEKAEIRGWVYGEPDGYDDSGDSDHEQEYHIYISLDLDWLPDPCLPKGVTTINSLAALAKAITPFNIVYTGGREAYTSGGQPDSDSETSPFRYVGHSLIVKIEIDGWNRSDGGNIPTKAKPSHDFGLAPSDWVAASNSPFSPPDGRNADSFVRWAFDPADPPSIAHWGTFRSWVQKS